MITYIWGNPTITEDDFGNVTGLILPLKGTDEDGNVAISKGKMSVGFEKTKQRAEWTDADTDAQKALVQDQLEAAIARKIELFIEQQSA